MNEYKIKYKEIEVIGKGASGTAYLIQKKSTKGYFVSKVMDLQYLNENDKKQIFQEIQLMQSLKHPNIVDFEEAFSDKSNIIIIMEYCEEGDLQFHINLKRQNETEFDQKIILNWFLQILMALYYLHQKNIVHRDLKSSNIFLTKLGNIKIGDFGISKILNQNQMNAQTLVGTPFYLSPEICESKPYDFKTDIWALGCILYEICSLKRAYDADNLLKLIFKIVKEERPSLPKKFENSDIEHFYNMIMVQDSAKRPDCQQILMDSCTIRIMNEFIIRQGHGIYEITKKIPIKPLNIHKNMKKVQKRSNSANKENKNDHKMKRIASVYKRSSDAKYLEFQKQNMLQKIPKSISRLNSQKSNKENLNKVEQVFSKKQSANLPAQMKVLQDFQQIQNLDKQKQQVIKPNIGYKNQSIDTTIQSNYQQSNMKKQYESPEQPFEISEEIIIQTDKSKDELLLISQQESQNQLYKDDFETSEIINVDDQDDDSINNSREEYINNSDEDFRITLQKNEQNLIEIISVYKEQLNQSIHQSKKNYYGNLSEIFEASIEQSLEKGQINQFISTQI